MLPEWNMDKEQYDDIVEEARRHIGTVYPEWTDFNYHDPGVTLIELFSWLKEIQQYYMNQVGPRHKLSYLSLLGETTEKRRGAHAYLTLDADREINLYPGFRFCAGEIAFETEESCHITKAGIQKYFSAGETITEYIGREQMVWEHAGRIYPFSEHPQPNISFYIGFDSPLPPNETIAMYVRMFEDYPVRRNPVQGREFLPFVTIGLSYYYEGEFRKAEWFSDGTYGFLETGSLAFRTGFPMQETEICGERGYFLRITLEEGEYDIPPVIEELLMNQVKASQVTTCAAMLEFRREDGTVSEDNKRFLFEAGHELACSGEIDIYMNCQGRYFHFPSWQRYQEEGGETAKYSVSLSGPNGTWDSLRFLCRDPECLDQFLIGVGNGFPDQEYELGDMEIVAEDFRIMVEDILHPGAYLDWTLVDNFGSSGKEDLHFRLDMEKNCIVFGDGFHGMPPEGSIILCSCKKTQGRRGNVKAGKITGMESKREGIVSVRNYREAQGGRDNETLEEAFFRIRKKLGSPMCAVTAADYEDRVRKTPGLMIDSCHAVCGHREPESDRTQITLIVKPFSMHKRKRNRIVFEGYRNNILHYMETYRPLGIRLSVAEPEYMDIYVYLDISVKAQYQNAQQEVKEAVEQFFHIRENRFGALLSYSELYGILDRMEAVEEIRALSMDARGSRVIKTPEGTIRLPEHAVAVLKEAVYSFVAE